jgi:hypothetical protein
MSKAVGDTFLITAVVLAVHPQGFKYGVHANGAPNIPPHQNPTAAELEEARTERPDTLEVEFVAPDGSKHRAFVPDHD